jgi:hypothetical protein
MRGLTVPRALVFALLAGLPVGTLRPQVPGRAGVPVELTLSGDLAGNGRTYEVTWYRQEKLGAAVGEPAEFVRAVSVATPADRRHNLATWAAPDTTITTFDSELNRLLRLPSPHGSLISVAVQYGAKAASLYVLRFDGLKLTLLNRIAGKGTFSFQQIGSPPRWVIVSDPHYIGELPELYAWDGSLFVRADRDFPQFWINKATSYAKGLRQEEVLPAYVLVQECAQTVRAFELAREPARAREPCLAARERIASGRQVWRGPSESPEQIGHEKEAAIAKIDDLLEGLKR